MSSNNTSLNYSMDNSTQEQPQFDSAIVPTNHTQMPSWITTKLDDVIPLWPDVYDEGLFPLLSHQQHFYQPTPFHHHHRPHHLSSFDEPSSSTGTISDLLYASNSSCKVASLSSSPSTCSSLPSPSNHNAYYPISSGVVQISNPDTALPPTAMTPLTSLHHWTRETLIARVMILEQELIQRNSSESLKQDGWQCRWDACDVVTSTLEQLTDHLYRIHVGKGKPTYFCGWTGCARHDKPFTKRHKMYNHIRTHTGERPFVCRTPGCQKRFSRPDSLSTHQKTHSNVRPFVCMDCGKTYFHARSLRKHLKASQHTSKVTS